MEASQREIELLIEPGAIRRDAVRSLARAAICVARSSKYGPSVYDVAKERWSADQKLHILLRAATTPTSTIEAAALQTVSLALLDTLKPYTAAGILIERGLKLIFGPEGTISVPTFGIAESGFVGERQPIPVKQLDLTTPALAPNKFSTIVALTHEQVHGSNAEAIVSRVLIESIARGLDRVIFSDAAAVPTVRPAGILNGVMPLTPDTGGTGQNVTDAMLNDLITLVSAIGPLAGSPEGYLIVGALPQIAAIQFRIMKDIPNAIVAGILAARTVLAIATQAFVIAVGPPIIERATQASLHMEDADPQPVPAEPTTSLFQTDSIALRLRMELSFGLRAPNAVAWMENVNW